MGVPIPRATTHPSYLSYLSYQSYLVHRRDPRDLEHQ
jgi:hypothetical protein